MEFKGTKGQWEILEYSNDLEIGNLQSDLVCSFPGKTYEFKANAKLIAYSLEMWELLGDIQGALTMQADPNLNVLIDEIYQLRLKATE